MKKPLKEIILAGIGWLILLVLISLLYSNFFSNYESNGLSYTKNLLISLGIAGIIAFLSLFPLLGLPGGIILFSLSPLMRFPEKYTDGDKAWPAAIMTSLLWPFSMTAGFFVKDYLLQTTYKEHANQAWMGSVIIGTILSVVFVNLLGKKGL